MTETIHLPLGGDSYSIHIGTGLLGDGKLIAQQLPDSRVLVVSNPTVAGHYLPALQAGLASNGLTSNDLDCYLMGEGERFKNLDTLEAILEQLLAGGHKRTTTLVALGGGVVGDTAGFAAAIYQRGVGYIQVPTTLLAQVDSSVGGKTGVNHRLGKNMIGAFHQPRCVVIDVDTLDTLPDRELSAGLAEVIKHGLLADRDYLDWVEARMTHLRQRDKPALIHAIAGSCRIKAAIVAEDEKEAGKRALLNLGHTFAHAIETGMGYGEWLHGEAVGAGLVMAADLSMRLGRCTLDEASRVKQLVKAAGLPIAPPAALTPDQFLALMARDKKAVEQGLRFILLDKGLGAAELVADVPPAALMETLQAGDKLCC